MLAVKLHVCCEDYAWINGPAGPPVTFVAAVGGVDRHIPYARFCACLCPADSL